MTKLGKKSVYVLIMAILVTALVICLFSACAKNDDSNNDDSQYTGFNWAEGFTLDKVYDGSAVVEPTQDNYTLNDQVEVKIQWQKKEGDAFVDISTPPVDVGTYQVTITVEKTDAIKGGSFSLPFTISPRDISTALLLTDDNPTYTGETLEAPIIAIGWGADGEEGFELELSSSTEYSFSGTTNAVHAGVYKVTFEGKGNYTGVKEYEWKINKKQVDVPEITGKIYTGETLIADIEQTEEYEIVQNEGGIEVGTYQVKLALKNAQDYAWADGTVGAEKAVSFIIAERTNYWTTELSVANVNYGNKATPVAVSKQGEIEYVYYTKDGEKLAEAPTNVGEYTVKAIVKGTESYIGLEAQKEFKIEKAAITITAKDVLLSYGDKKPEYEITLSSPLAYGERIESLTKKSDFVANYKQFAELGTYTLSPSKYESDNYTFTYVDGTITVQKADPSIALSKSIEKSYDGTAIELAEEHIKIKTLRGIEYSDLTLKWVDENGQDASKPVNAGTYRLHVTRAADEHFNAFDQTFEVVIAKSDNEVVFSNTYSSKITNIQYSGTGIVLPVASDYTATNGSATFSWVDSDKNAMDSLPVNAGKYYLRAHIDGTDNYNVYDKDIEVVIQRKKYTLHFLYDVVGEEEVESEPMDDEPSTPSIEFIYACKYDANKYYDGMDVDSVDSDCYYTDSPAEVKVQYYKKVGEVYVLFEEKSIYSGEGDDEMMEGMPIDERRPYAAGEYKVTLTQEQTDNYEAQSVSEYFTISKAKRNPFFCYEEESVGPIVWTERYVEYDESDPEMEGLQRYEKHSITGLFFPYGHGDYVKVCGYEYYDGQVEGKNGYSAVSSTRYSDGTYRYKLNKEYDGEPVIEDDFEYPRYYLDYRFTNSVPSSKDVVFTWKDFSGNVLQGPPVNAGMYQLVMTDPEDENIATSSTNFWFSIGSKKLENVSIGAQRTKLKLDETEKYYTYTFNLTDEDGNVYKKPDGKKVTFTAYFKSNTYGVGNPVVKFESDCDNYEIVAGESGNEAFVTRVSVNLKFDNLGYGGTIEPLLVRWTKEGKMPENGFAFTSLPSGLVQIGWSTEKSGSMPGSNTFFGFGESVGKGKGLRLFIGESTKNVTIYPVLVPIVKTGYGEANYVNGETGDVNFFVGTVSATGNYAIICDHNPGGNDWRGDVYVYTDLSMTDEVEVPLRNNTYALTEGTTYYFKAIIGAKTIKVDYDYFLVLKQ